MVLKTRGLGNGATVKVEILGSEIFSVNGKRHGSVRRNFQYCIRIVSIVCIRCAFIRMYTWRLHQ